MSFEQIKEDTVNIHEQFKAYIKSNIDYFKLRSFEIVIKCTTLVLRYVFITFFIALIILFCSVSVAFYIGKILDSYALGFLIVGGFYFICTIILATIKIKFIDSVILNKFSAFFFKD